MNARITEHSIHGECIFLDNGKIEVGIPLSFGIRICHLSLKGGKNVFFEQPSEMKALTTEDGWRIRGGHRLWLAPESQKTYHPDNDPVEYRLIPNGVEVTQKPDPRLNVKKTVRVELEEEGVRVTHFIENVGDQPLTAALWPISAMRGGGVERIPLMPFEEGKPFRRYSVWSHTDAADSRAKYGKEEIVLTHLPIDRPYKIGVDRIAGEVSYDLGDTVFYKSYEIKKDALYPDGDVAYEAYLNMYIAEIESLSPIFTLNAGETSEGHSEFWRLEKKGENI